MESILNAHQPPDQDNALGSQSDSVHHWLADSIAMAVQLAHFKDANSVQGTIISGLTAFISALGVLFAAGAIVAAVLLWKQSKEGRALINKLIKESREEIATTIAGAKSLVQESVAQSQALFTALVAEKTAELERNAAAVREEMKTANVAEKAALQTRLDKMQEDIKRLTPKVPSPPVKNLGLGGSANAFTEALLAAQAPLANVTPTKSLVDRLNEMAGLGGAIADITWLCLNDGFSLKAARFSSPVCPLCGTAMHAIG